MSCLAVAEQGGDLSSGGKAELAQDVFDMCVDGASGDEELGRDLLVGLPAGQQVCHFPFAGAEGPALGSRQRNGNGLLAERVGDGPILAEAAPFLQRLVEGTCAEALPGLPKALVATGEPLLEAGRYVEHLAEGV